jgi:multidrug transporter EmrE-like cation transporter
MLDFILFAVYTLGSASSLMLIKHWFAPAKAAYQAGHGFFLPGLCVMGGAGLYIASFLVWMVILTRNELTVAYPIAVGLTLVVSTIGAVALLGEAVSSIRIAGMFLIVFGIALVVRS